MSILGGDRKKGFTLIEISLSVAFIGILSIIIVLLINNSIATYRRGATLNRLNSVGMDVVDDLRHAVQSSPGYSISRLCPVYYSGRPLDDCTKDNGRNFMFVTKYAEVRYRHDSSSIGRNIPVYGAFCTGTYSYIWNSGYFFSDDYTIANNVEPAQLWYKKMEESNTLKMDQINGRPFRLLKVSDENRAVCISSFYGRNPNGENDQSIGQSSRTYSIKRSDNNLSNTINTSGDIFDITSYGSIEEDPQDIIANDSSNDLAFYDLWVSPTASGRANYGTFYSISFVLGSTRGGINIMNSGNYCVPPEDFNDTTKNKAERERSGSLEDFDYCAINKFKFAVQANGG